MKRLRYDKNNNGQIATSQINDKIRKDDDDEDNYKQILTCLNIIASSDHVTITAAAAEIDWNHSHRTNNIARDEMKIKFPRIFSYIGLVRSLLFIYLHCFFILFSFVFRTFWFFFC